MGLDVRDVLPARARGVAGDRSSRYQWSMGASGGIILAIRALVAGASGETHHAIGTNDARLAGRIPEPVYSKLPGSPVIINPRIVCDTEFSWLLHSCISASPTLSG